jgi:hypothetical protein
VTGDDLTVVITYVSFIGRVIVACPLVGTDIITGAPEH